MSRLSISYLTVAPLKEHMTTVIFAHDLGESGHVWKGFAQEMSERLPHTKWILPHGPRKSVTTSNHQISMMPAWFNVQEIEDLGPENESQLLQNIETFDQLIEKEMATSGLKSERIFLGGCGQGGMISLGAGLTLNKKLGGLIALSAALPLRYQLREMFSLHAKQLPIFWSIGADEQTNNVKFALESVEFLRKMGFAVSTNSPMGIQFNVFPGFGRAADEREVDELIEWLSRVGETYFQRL